jgi:hypothetical protein
LHGADDETPGICASEVDTAGRNGLDDFMAKQGAIFFIAFRKGVNSSPDFSDSFPLDSMPIPSLERPVLYVLK